MSLITNLEKRVLQAARVAEYALRVAFLQAESIRLQARRAATAIKDEAGSVAQRITAEFLGPESDDSATLIEKVARAEMLAEQWTNERRAEAVRQAREILAETRSEVGELLRQAELQANAILANARGDETRLRLETDAGVARLRAEAEAAGQQIRDEATREAEGLPQPRAEDQQHPPLDAGIELGTSASLGHDTAGGRVRRALVALGVVLGLSAIGGAVWAFAANDGSDTSQTRLASGTSFSVPPSTVIATNEPTVTTASAATVGASSVTRPVQAFDAEAFFAKWTNEAASLAPTALPTVQQQRLRKPVVAGAAGNAESLSKALADGWVKGYGIFFGSSTSGAPGATSATAAVYQYSSEAATERAFSAARRAYLSKSFPGSVELDPTTLESVATSAFGARYSGSDGEIITAYLNYPNALVQVSVTGDRSAETEDAFRSIVVTISAWAKSFGFLR